MKAKLKSTLSVRSVTFKILSEMQITCSSCEKECTKKNCSVWSILQEKGYPLKKCKNCIGGKLCDECHRKDK